MIKKYKIIVVAFVIIGLLSGLFCAILPEKTYSKDKEIINPETIFSDEKATFNDVRELYHKTINSIFNEAFAQITAGTADTKVPEKDEDCAFDAKQLNVSTYCVAWRAATLYKKYEEALSIKKDALFEGNEDTNIFSLFTQFDLYDSLYTRRQAIDKELPDAEQALDTTLGAYKEFQYAYQMHKMYAETFKLLVKYRDFMAEIRAQIEKFPSKFIDASTSNCQ